MVENLKGSILYLKKYKYKRKRGEVEVLYRGLNPDRDEWLVYNCFIEQALKIT